MNRAGPAGFSDSHGEVEFLLPIVFRLKANQIKIELTIDQNSATGPVLQGGGSVGVQSTPLTESCPYGNGRASCCLKSW